MQTTDGWMNFYCTYNYTYISCATANGSRKIAFQWKCNADIAEREREREEKNICCYLAEDEIRAEDTELCVRQKAEFKVKIFKLASIEQQERASK